MSAIKRRMRDIARAVGKAVSLVVLSLALPSCSKLRETRTCKAAAQLVSEAFDSIETMAKVAGPDSERRIAKGYVELATRLAALTPSEGELSAAFTEYRSVLLATDAALRAHAEAGQSKSAAAESRRELERLGRRQKAAATRIDAECRS